MKKVYMAIFIALLGCSSCSKDNDDSAPEPPGTETVELSMVDKSATAETKALYARLWDIQQTGFMFGHHDDLFYGRKWYDVSGNSDTKEVCGDYPAVFSVDFAEIMDDRCEGNEANAVRKRCILEARRRGEVIIACCHLNNPLTGGDSWDNSSAEVVRGILEDGSAVQAKFKTWLDRLATFAGELKDDQRKPIPVIFRPFHEHTQTWSWWGKSCTTEAEFIGMDCYHGLNPATFSSNLKTISELSKKKKKPCGVTETGVEGFTDKDYWSKQILTPATGRKVSMIVMWRNKFVGGNESDMHYFSVFKGHASEADFIKFHANELTFFSSDLPDMYQMPENVEVN